MPSVLITGASTGIGRVCARSLAAAGFRVLAGVRREEDAASIRAEGAGRMEPLLFDVADAGSIAQAAARVREMVGEAGLQGLVNNAGIVKACPLELLPLPVLRRQLEVNLTGVLAVTQAFLPLLRQGEGRIVNIGSIAGFTAFPGEGAYVISKFALEGLNEVLRRELLPWKIPVVLLSPGAVVSPIWQKSTATWEQLRGELPEEALAPYEPLLAAVERAVAAAETGAIPAEQVAEEVVAALTRKRPRPLRPIGPGACAQRFAAHWLPAWLMDCLVRREIERHRLPEDGPLPTPPPAARPAGPKTVLVTGAAGGIGGTVTRLLAARGHRVYAGMLPAEMESSPFAGESGDIRPLALDLTGDDARAAAAARLRADLGAAGLDGLVNSAGIVVTGPAEFLPLEDFRRQLEVNLVGTLGVTQAFLPLLRAAQGRIVNLGSVAGFFGLPFQGAYAASKFGLRGMNDTLRRELRSWGIRVALVEPGVVATGIWERSEADFRRVWAALPPEAGELYELPYRAACSQFEDGPSDLIQPEPVARRVLHALESARPRARYLVGRHLRWRWALVRLMPTAVVDRIVLSVMRKLAPAEE